MSSWVRCYDGKTRTKYERLYKGLVRNIETGETYPYQFRARGKREVFERRSKPFCIHLDDGSMVMVKLVKESFRWDE